MSACGILGFVEVAEFIVGIALLTVGGVLVLGRERIVASHERRFSGRGVQPAMAWLVLGTILVVAGVIEVLLAFT